MTFAPGTRIGAYEITSPLGSGGMGEVYRARDLTLDRDVAIKVLPASFAGDAERLMRFEREAKTLASLNHPHIAQVYGLERSDDTSALVMELVEGEDLAARIARSPVPPDDALAIAGQIAEALEAAHEAGIVHRDLKPANVRNHHAFCVAGWRMAGLQRFFRGHHRKSPDGRRSSSRDLSTWYRAARRQLGGRWIDRVRRLGAQSEWAVSRPGRRVASPCSRGCPQ